MSSKLRFVLVDADLAEGDLGQVAETIRQALQDGGIAPTRSVLLEEPHATEPPPALPGPQDAAPRRDAQPPRAAAADRDGKVLCPNGCGRRVKPRGLKLHQAYCPAIHREKKNAGHVT